MESIYDKKWNDIFAKAAMHRLKPATPGPDTICILRSAFDNLLKVFEEASRLNISSHAAKEIHFTKTDNGFECTMDNPYFQVKGSGRTLLEALSVSLRDWDRRTEEWIR